MIKFYFTVNSKIRMHFGYQIKIIKVKEFKIHICIRIITILKLKMIKEEMEVETIVIKIKENKMD